LASKRLARVAVALEQMRLMQKARVIRRLPRERCARIRIYLARFLSLVSPLVWLGFRRDYPISEAMTSFFFTFFKVFLNGCLGLFVVTLPRLLKIQRADKFFFHFFSLFFEGPVNHEFAFAQGPRPTRGHEFARIKKAEDDFTREPRISRVARMGPNPSDQLSVSTVLLFTVP
jgi:hypothetical protein